MNIIDLLSQMEKVATTLITSQYITDFTVHDTFDIESKDAQAPFIWLVREQGTGYFETTCPKSLEKMLQIMDYYDSRKTSYVLYLYNIEKLSPIFPCTVRQLIATVLKQQSAKSKN